MWSMEHEENMNADLWITDERLGGILLVEGLPGDGRLCDGTCVVRFGMIGLVLVFKQLDLEGKIVACEQESNELMYGRPFH